MTKTGHTQKAGASFIIALGLACISCNKSDGVGANPTRANNLGSVACQSQNGGNNDVAIEIEPNKNVLKDPNNRVIFVCATETVHWFTKASGVSFEVQFVRPAEAATLFTTGITDLKSKDLGGGKIGTDSPAVAAPFDSSGNRRDFAHTYKLIVTRGEERYELDPHVIPM
jgi:hypothetical protein